MGHVHGAARRPNRRAGASEEPALDHGPTHMLRAGGERRALHNLPEGRRRGRDVNPAHDRHFQHPGGRAVLSGIHDAPHKSGKKGSRSRVWIAFCISYCVVAALVHC